MEQQLTESQWHALASDGTTGSQHQTPVKERDVIHRLEGQVDEQRAMRLNDAKQVEAKAAKIKEWVTNKLRDVSCLIHFQNYISTTTIKKKRDDRLACPRSISIYTSRPFPSTLRAVFHAGNGIQLESR